MVSKDLDGKSSKRLVKKFRNIRFDASNIPLSNGEHRRSLSYSCQKLFKKHSRLFYFEMDIGIDTHLWKYSLELINNFHNTCPNYWLDSLKLINTFHNINWNWFKPLIRFNQIDLDLRKYSLKLIQTLENIHWNRSTFSLYTMPIDIHIRYLTLVIWIETRVHTWFWKYQLGNS